MRLWWLPLVLLTVACAGSDDTDEGGSAGSGGVTTSATGGGTTSTSAGGSGGGGAAAAPARAVVVSLNRDGMDDDAVAVMTLQPDGSILDTGVEFGGVVNPRHAAMRPDGREALVAFGYLGGDYGVVRLTFESDGSNAALAEIVTLGDSKNIFALTYASDTLALLAIASNPQHETVALVRSTPDEPFAAGGYSDIENNWPLAAAADGHGGAYLLRGSLMNEPDTELFALDHGAGGFSRAGNSVLISPSSLNIVVGDDVVYSPTSNPADPVTVDDLESTGLLYAFTRSGGDLTALPVFGLPNAGTEIAIDPSRQILVVNDVVYEVISDTPNARALRWTTVDLDASGVPTAAATTSAVHPALLIHAMALTAEGTLVTAIQLYEDQAPSPEQIYPLSGWRRVGGEWTQVGAPVYLDGQPNVAVWVAPPAL